MTLHRRPPRADAIRTFAEADEFPLRPDEAGAYKTETYNQWVYDPVADVGLNIWLASSDNSFPNFMSTVIVYDRGRIWVGKGEGRGNPQGGVGGGAAYLSIREPYHRHEIDVLCLVSESDPVGFADPFSAQNGPAELCRMTLAVDIRTPPIEQGSQGDRGESPSSGTIPRTAIRYEQLCRITGPIRIGERTVQLDAYGMRSHRRNSASIYASGAVGHSWATALFPSGRGFHLLSYQVQPDAAVGFLYGHYFDGERYHDAEVTRFPFYSGVLGPEACELELKVEGRTHRFGLAAQKPLASAIPPQGVLLTRAPGRFTLDGEVGGGVLERSLMPQFPAGGEFRA
jgi:hypothetical protein